MSDVATPPPPLPWLPLCPGCAYDLTGLGDGRCPECGRTFSLAALRPAAEHQSGGLLTDAQQAAILWFAGWTAFLCLPVWLVMQGTRLSVRAGLELLHGCHWTD